MSQFSAIILAAGKGTRIKSETPKVLLPLCGRTLVGHVNEAVVGAGADPVVFVVRHERERVASHLKEINPTAIIADQDDIKGTGRAAWCALQALPPETTGSVLVIAGDCPMFTAHSLQELRAAHENSNNAVTVLSAVLDDPYGYGRIVRDAAGPDETAGTANATGNILGIVEEKDATDTQRQICEVGTSTYVFDLDFLRTALENIGTDNAQGEMYLTDAIAAAVAAGSGVGSYILPNAIEAAGVNDLVQLADLQVEMNRRIQEEWLRTGVRIIDPATTHVDVTVQLEPDAVVEPGTVLRGNTKVARYGVVGPNSELTDVTVGEGARLPHTVATAVTIDAHQVTAPFTVLGVSAR
ncbi:MAG: NTP transferase domain-containing protein [Trueperella sp.]|nr:NTP transferase domain-containing protein [Trueperella sp.]